MAKRRQSTKPEGNPVVQAKQPGAVIEGLSDQQLMQRITAADQRTEKSTSLQRADPAVPEKLSLAMAPSDRERAEAFATMKKACAEFSGVKTPDLGYTLIYQIMSLLAGMGCTDFASQMQIAMPMMAEMRPGNATEAMLTVQMIGVHHTALMCLRNADAGGQTPEGRDANILSATRLMRLFNEQLEAMAKLKGKAGQQKVTVEHVHVNAGGQAIVGAVAVGKGNHGEGGGEKR